MLRSRPRFHNCCARRGYLSRPVIGSILHGRADWSIHRAYTISVLTRRPSSGSSSNTSRTATGISPARGGYSSRPIINHKRRKHSAGSSYRNMPSNGVKRKATASPSSPSTKKTKTPAENDHYDHSRKEEEYGIVDRRFYPSEMSNERALQYNANELERPIEALELAQSSTRAARAKIPLGQCVVHWFKTDLRIADNKALHLASKKAQESGTGSVPLICVYLVSPQDFEAHATSVARVDFIIRSLAVLQRDLAHKNIPFFVERVEKRKDVPERILQRCEEWGASHLFANTEYEVDELRREAKITKMGVERGIAVDVVPDTCVIAPGELSSGSGSQYAVYSPWFRAWLAYLKSHPRQLDLFDEPAANDPAAMDEITKFQVLLETSGALPVEGPINKRFSSNEERQRFKNLWPAGEHAARDRLELFIEERIRKYKDTRNFPAQESTSMLSVHLAAGTISARTIISAVRDANGARKSLDSGADGITGYISEIAWRDFYKHVLAHWPYVCMNKPFKPEYTDITWDYDDALFEKWCNGQTGYPYIDAAMRQLNSIGYMHNRARMGVASFLAKDLLLDWRRGERYFMLKLIDGDFASNNGGWGFSSSTGVDPQPYFRIFNPILQSEKFDPEGEYIRKWVPELKGVTGNAVHDPYHRGAAKEAEKAGYPKMCVEHKERRNIALARYKQGLGRDTA